MHAFNSVSILLEANLVWNCQLTVTQKGFNNVYVYHLSCLIFVNLYQV